MNPSGFAIQRGTNLSHWLSQDFGWAPRATWITENDLRFIAKQGFDHVRLPIDEKELWREDGTQNADAFALMLKAIGWARQYGLRVIVDLHTVRAHHFNAVNEGMTPNTLFTDPQQQEHFLDLWRQLSAALKPQPVDAVAYEIMNEPVADDPEDWNKLVAKAHAMIRELEPGRVIVIGSNRWQIPQTLPQLKVPAGDKNIILSTHTYSPLLFTHYTAEWTEAKIYQGAVHYPGPVVSRADYDQLMVALKGSQKDMFASSLDNWGPARIKQELEPAIRRAQELGLQLYCGEFGCLPSVPRQDRLAYYRDIIGVFESNGMAWANWEYKGDFGIFEWHGTKGLIGAPDDEFISTLLAHKQR
ncbi:glycoside hydrolase family 5 protein [Opitutus terrae]|uniref:Glycoside hydrolase family 5 n=1 Tax=Opitutus terrae (strain DSM 11246 / JCM 15787 / PB90-1) TaxID=452637 RepID=B1ZTE2_OPITP|nr:cellulase family glycosylhydrolase [Opitutus terrae]ACB76596.1 glycoside hydrolase family 5 [Opitutus terrae PB90-1]